MGKVAGVAINLAIFLGVAACVFVLIRFLTNFNGDLGDLSKRDNPDAAPKWMIKAFGDDSARTINANIRNAESWGFLVEGPWKNPLSQDADEHTRWKDGSGNDVSEHYDANGVLVYGDETPVAWADRLPDPNFKLDIRPGQIDDFLFGTAKSLKMF